METHGVVLGLGLGLGLGMDLDLDWTSIFYVLCVHQRQYMNPVEHHRHLDSGLWTLDY